MASVPIPFPFSSAPGEKPALGQGRLINAYFSPEGEQKLWRRVPGLSLFLAGIENVRGMLFFEARQQLLIVSGAKVGWVQALPGAETTIRWLGGEIDGSRPVCISRNNNAATDIVITTGTTSYVVAEFAVEPYPPGNISVPNSVSMLDGYFLFTYADGFIRASGLNTTDIDGLSYTKAESSPDGLLRGVVLGQLFYAMGTASIEVFRDVATTPFPLQRVHVLSVGLFGPWAVAGAQQEGWDNPFFFVASDGTVRILDGYQDSVVSTSDVTRDILTVTDRDAIRAFVYVVGKNPFLTINGPDWTWEYNLSTKHWHQRRSYQNNRWRAELSIQAFRRWIVGDTAGAGLLEIDPSVAFEANEPLIFEVESAAVAEFPQRVAGRRADFDFVVGYGRERGLDPIEIDPVVHVSFSHDGGVSFGTPLERPLGREGLYGSLVSVLNCGLSGAQGFKWKVVVSDPIDCTLKGGSMEADVRLK